MVFDPLADRYMRHSQTLRGAVRHTLLARQLEGHLPAPPARIIDVGGGAGAQELPLARRGYSVTLIDPSQEMLSRAESALAEESTEIRDRVRLVRARGEDAPGLLGDYRFDAVLCHGVIMYLDDPDALLHALVSLARPRGIISILTKNKEALAMRPALEGRYGDAVPALAAGADRGGMEVSTRAHTVEYVSRRLESSGARVVKWYGGRIFTDHVGDRPPGPDLGQILELEQHAGAMDPYRRVARLIHVVGERAGP